MKRIVVFIGWSPEPQSMPNHRIFLSSIHSQQLEPAARVHAEVAHQVLLRPALVVAVVAGVDDQDVVLLDRDRGGLEHRGRDHVPVADLRRDVDDRPLADQEIERIGGHVAHAVGRVHARRRCGCPTCSAVSIRCATMLTVCRFWA